MTNRTTILASMIAGAALLVSPAVAKPAKKAPTPTAAANLRSTIANHYARYRIVGENIPAQYCELQYTPQLQALINRAGGGPDYDPFCACQEYQEREFSYNIRTLTVNNNQAEARLDVAPAKGWHQQVTIKFLRNASGRWLVDDVIDEERKSLKAEATKAKPGSWRTE